MACRLRQAMGSLDIAEVAPLEDRVAALGHIVEELPQLAASADPGTSSQGPGEPVGRGEPPPAGPGDPTHGVIEAGCTDGQVEHGFVDARLRWHPGRMPSHDNVGGTVHDNPGHPGDATFGRNRDVDGAALFVNQADLLRGRAVCQDRSWPGAEHRGPAQGRWAHLAAECGVRAGGQALPSTGPEPVANSVGADSRGQRLRTAEHAALAATCLLEFTSFHFGEPARLGAPPPHPLWTAPDCG